MADLDKALFGMIGAEQSERPMLEGMHTLDKAALLSAPLPVVGDVIGGAADVRALKDDPSPLNITLAALGLLPFVPSGMRLLKSTDDVSPRFKKAMQRELDKGANRPISREAIVEMDANDFLDVLPKSRSEQKMKRLREALIEQGQELEEMPTLFLDDTGDVIEVFGHEGRHRMRTLQQMGEQRVPVRIVRQMGRGEFKPPREVVAEDKRELFRISREMEEREAAGKSVSQQLFGED